MALKILGGKLKNFVVKVVDSPDLRPTSVLLRRRIFDSKQDLSHYFFIDLCAGSGAMGIEALSRNAHKIWLNEFSKNHFTTLLKNRQSLINLQQFHEGQIIVTHKNFIDILPLISLENNENAPVILFFDPPYQQTKLYQDFFEVFQQFSWPSGSEIWIEASEENKDVLKIFENAEKAFKYYQQGAKFICKMIL